MPNDLLAPGNLQGGASISSLLLLVQTLLQAKLDPAPLDLRGGDSSFLDEMMEVLEKRNEQRDGADKSKLIQDQEARREKIKERQESRDRRINEANNRERERQELEERTRLALEAEERNVLRAGKLMGRDTNPEDVAKGEELLKKSAARLESLQGEWRNFEEKYGPENAKGPQGKQDGKSENSAKTDLQLAQIELPQSAAYVAEDVRKRRADEPQAPVIEPTTVTSLMNYLHADFFDRIKDFFIRIQFAVNVPQEVTDAMNDYYRIYTQNYNPSSELPIAQMNQTVMDDMFGFAKQAFQGIANDPDLNNYVGNDLLSRIRGVANGMGGGLDAGHYDPLEFSGNQTEATDFREYDQSVRAFQENVRARERGEDNAGQLVPGIITAIDEFQDMRVFDNTKYLCALQQGGCKAATTTRTTTTTTTTATTTTSLVNTTTKAPTTRNTTSADNTTVPEGPEEKQEGLSAGENAGIGVGVVAAAGALFAGAALAKKAYKKNRVLPSITEEHELRALGGGQEGRDAASDTTLQEVLVRGVGTPAATPKDTQRIPRRLAPLPTTIVQNNS